MKTIVNIIAGIGFLFFGALFFSAFGLYIAHSDPLNFFNFKELEVTNFEVTKSNNENLDVSLKYTIDGKGYNKDIGIYEKLFYENVPQEPEVLYIMYNETFPSVSYIKGLKMIRKYKTGMLFSGLCLLFLLYYTFSKRKEYWFSKYRSFYKEKL